MLKRLIFAVLTAAFAATAPLAAHATQSDPAAARIETFDSALLDTMKNAKSLGVQGRYRRMAPAVEAAYDLPTMTRFAVGPAWDKFTPAQQQQMIAAFTRLSVANYAHNFDGWSGESFVIDGVQARGADKIVTTRMVRPNAAPVSLIYRMRQAGGGWKIIDVYYGAISQLTTRRSDFAGPAAKGAPSLIAHVNQLADNLMK
ncbi:MAG TPA: ABC transporter substrate-binding protein [Caulobacteraceae bacterium]|nr:ABC transporter substrate-binding protein [Caulobacteraceae bacterium]